MDVVNWRWVFYINLPLGIASIILLFAGLSESKSLVKPKLDWLGIPLLAGWIALLDLGFLNGGSTYPWLSWEEVAFFAGSAVPLRGIHPDREDQRRAVEASTRNG